ncbi:hypothetical protein [Lentzea nigeriaca]|uniref:hypothetical protein n=1 Tax=Lentzea nigeriaca TaxID=1128665 RepID=UPI0019584FFA|nr:hypothetical protein [Lentzea nigeriaca]MBM7861130.1 hypothetical protein [Lentzea nigeriaca]
MESRTDRVKDALVFTYGYTSYGLEYLLQQWPEMMRTKQGRDRALETLKLRFAPLSMGLDALPDWVDDARASRGWKE